MFALPALGDQAVRRQHDQFPVVAGLQRPDLGERRVDVVADGPWRPGHRVVVRVHDEIFIRTPLFTASSLRYAAQGQQAIATSTVQGSVLSPISP
jgi:hypothetical protein